MADDGNPLVPEAIDIVARAALAAAVREGSEIAWENYPDIGEDDWHLVVRRLMTLTPEPRGESFDAAYAFLARRAASVDV